MDQKQILKQMLDFNKATFDNAFKAMAMLQDQTQKMTASLVERANWLPEEGKKAVSNWIDSYKKGREDFKKTVDKNFEKVEGFFKTNQ